jgi:hypothetical protein
MGAPMNDPRLNRGTLSNHTSAPTTSHARRESLSNGKDYNAELASSSTLTRRPSFASASSITLTNQSSLHIVLPTSASAATSSGSLTNLRRCVIDLSVPASTSPFRGLALRDVSDSVIVVGRVDGPVHITAVSNSIIVVAARQVRIHECKDVDFYLHCSSHPIIEDCSHVRFAPLPSPYVRPFLLAYSAHTHQHKSQITASTAPEENQWDQVDDFKWLKAGPSPNWTTLSEAGRLSNEAWSTVQGEAGVEDILRALHIPRKKRTSSSAGSDP